MKRLLSLLSNDQGVVLLLVLAVVALFTVMVANFSADENFDIELAYNFKDSTQAQYIARSGVEAALSILKKDDINYDSEDEDWGSFAENALAASAYLNGATFTGSLTDERGKFDLNGLGTTNLAERKFREDQFRRLIKILEIDMSEKEKDDLIKAIQDWLDKDSDTENDSEDDYYQSLDKPYTCKNGPMDSPEEILLVKGMKPEYYYGTENFKGLRNYVTVGTGGKINVNTASDIVLRSISDSITEDTVAKILDSRPYKTAVANWVQTLNLNANAEDVQGINSTLDVKTSLFCAEMKGLMPSGAQINVKALLQRVNNNVRIVYYKIH